MSGKTSVSIITVCERLPRWVDEGFNEYASRLERVMSLRCVDLPLAQRGKNTDIKRAVIDESTRMQALIAKGALVVALDTEGETLDSEAFAAKCSLWREQYRDWTFLIGGPDGLSADCLRLAHFKLSLGRMTLPHALVRIVLGEQLFRAHCILSNHPYHRVGKRH
jgi:23S rRNA (pseudouridine1915-N3)-methyltransferase